MVSHLDLGLDPPIGLDRESGRDRGTLWVLWAHVRFLMSLKVIYFQSIFLIDFYIKRLIYMQEYEITSPNLLCSRKFKRKQKLQ